MPEPVAKPVPQQQPTKKQPTIEKNPENKQVPQQNEITEIHGSKVEGDVFMEEELESEESLRGNV